MKHLLVIHIDEFTENKLQAFDAAEMTINNNSMQVLGLTSNWIIRETTNHI